MAPASTATGAVTILAVLRTSRHLLAGLVMVSERPRVTVWWVPTEMFVVNFAVMCRSAF